MNTYPTPQSLLPYGPTALLVDMVNTCDQKNITVTRTVRPDEHYGPGLSLEGAIELCAQGAACFNALSTTGGTGPTIGVLAGVEGFGLSRAIVVGEIVVATAQKTISMGSLAKYDCTLSDQSGYQLSHGTLTVGTV